MGQQVAYLHQAQHMPEQDHHRKSEQVLHDTTGFHILHPPPMKADHKKIVIARPKPPTLVGRPVGICNVSGHFLQNTELVVSTGGRLRRDDADRIDTYVRSRLRRDDADRIDR